MLRRRTVLSAVGLGVASLSGCLQDTVQTENGDESARGLSALPTPRVTGARTLHVVFESDLSAYRADTGSLADRDDDIGESAQRFREEFAPVDLSSIDRVSVQTADGDGLEQAVAAVLDGTFDTEAIESWIEAEEGGYQRGSRGEYTWFGPPEDGQGGVFLAASDRRLLVRAPSAEVSSVASVARETIDAASEDGEWFAADEPELVDALDAVDGHVNVGALWFPPESSIDGLEYRERPLRNARAGALGSSPTDAGVDVDAVVEFGEAPDVDAVRTALESRSEGPIGEDPLAVDLEYSQQDTAVHVSGTFDDETLAGYDVAPAVRLPLFLYVGSFGGGSGQSSPIVAWQFDQHEDGRIEFVHTSGDRIDSGLTVTYVHDGERVREQWQPEEGITAGRQYVTDEPADAGTTLKLLWTADDEEVVLGEYTST